MLLKVKVPEADAAFRGGYLISWHMAVGDDVGFGSPLCDIAVDEFLLMRRTKRAALLGSTRRLSRRRVKDRFDLKEGRSEVRIQLISAERSLKLIRVIAQPGDRIRFGDVIGLVGSGGDDPDTDLNSVSDAHVSVDFIDASELDPL